MHIGIIGAGHAAQTLARHILVNGHQVMLSNSRGPETLARVIADLGDGAEAGTREDVLKTDLVILSVNWPDVPKAVEGLKWDGQILIDATNAHADKPADFSAAGIARSRVALGGRTSSEIVSELTPGARLVKSISNMPMGWIQDFSPNKPRTVLFTSGVTTSRQSASLSICSTAWASKRSTWDRWRRAEPCTRSARRFRASISTS